MRTFAALVVLAILRGASAAVPAIASTPPSIPLPSGSHGHSSSPQPTPTPPPSTCTAHTAACPTCTGIMVSTHSIPETIINPTSTQCATCTCKICPVVDCWCTYPQQTYSTFIKDGCQWCSCAPNPAYTSTSRTAITSPTILTAAP